jgi:hypothetical protein
MQRSLTILRTELDFFSHSFLDLHLLKSSQAFLEAAKNEVMKNGPLHCLLSEVVRSAHDEIIFYLYVIASVRGFLMHSFLSDLPFSV